MTTLYIECCKGFVYILKHAMGIALVWHPKERNIQKHVMRTDPKTPIRTYYMFRGLIRGFEGANQVRIARTIEVSRGDLSTSYLCAEVVQPNFIWAMK